MSDNQGYVFRGPIVSMSVITGRKSLRLLARASILGILAAPWPVDRKPYTASGYFRDTIRRLEHLPTRVVSDDFRVGLARADLTPPSPVPPAGFIGQVFQPYQGLNSKCFGKALTIANRQVAITIVAADLLLIDERMVRSILSRTGLARDQVYFTATHTHSGPGGWGNHPLERLVAGTYDPLVFDHLCEKLVEVVLSSRSRLEPAEMAFVQTTASGLQRNRISPDRPTNDALSAWIFRSKDPGSKRRGLATLVTFGAHATISHPVPPRLGGDYPAAFAAILEDQADAGVVLFASGTVGDASPVRIPADSQQRSVEAYGKILADCLIKKSHDAKFSSVIDLGNLGLEVDLPPVQVPFFSPSLRFNPLCSWWVGRRRTYLHALKIGPAILVGFPGDISGQLANRFHDPTPIIATSFNGDYQGYLVSSDLFRSHPCYETRWMSFHGPDLGDYLVDLAQGCIKQISNCKHRQTSTKTDAGGL